MFWIPNQVGMRVSASQKPRIPQAAYGLLNFKLKHYPAPSSQ